jgi:hypothetical protein
MAALNVITAKTFQVNLRLSFHESFIPVGDSDRFFSVKTAQTRRSLPFNRFNNRVGLPFTAIVALLPDSIITGAG